MVESLVAEYFARDYPTYYIKAGNEVDISYVDKKQFFPIEIKRSSKLANKEFIQIKKYENGKILYKGMEEHHLGKTQVYPLLKTLIS